MEGECTARDMVCERRLFFIVPIDSLRLGYSLVFFIIHEYVFLENEIAFLDGRIAPEALQHGLFGSEYLAFGGADEDVRLNIA